MNTDSKKGYVVTASISSIRDLSCDEIWLISRSGRQIPGVRWVPELAPDGELYNKYLHEWKGTHEEQWWPEYRKMFNQQLQDEFRLEELRKIYKLVGEGKVIGLVCFCVADTYCHRSLIAEFLKSHNINAVEQEKKPKKDPAPKATMTQPDIFGFK